MNKILEEVTDWIRSKQSKIIVGISGHGASGKTTFTNNLITLLNPMKINYLNTDPYIIGSNLRNYAPIEYEYKGQMYKYKMTACHPVAHQINALERDIKMLRHSLNFYTMETHYRESEFINSSINVNIVEGMSVAFCNPEFFDLKIYFYTDGDTEFIRRSDRDIKERGSNLEFLKQSHEQRRIQYDLFMHPYHRHFDIVIKNSNEDYQVEKFHLP